MANIDNNHWKKTATLFSKYIYIFFPENDGHMLNKKCLL